MATKTKFRFFLYNNDSGEFREIRHLSFCGRSESDIDFPDDRLISRRHCQFTIAANDIYIEDLASTNQSRVNGVPLTPHKRRRLLLNDVIEIGTQRLILTNQNRYAPANVKDPERTRVYKAIRRDDGSLTSFVTGLITKQTLIRVNRRVFQSLQIKKAVKSLSGRRPARVSVRGGEARESRGLSLVIAGSLIALTLGSLYTAGMLDGALDGIGERLQVIASGGPAPVLRQASTDAE